MKSTRLPARSFKFVQQRAVSLQQRAHISRYTLPVFQNEPVKDFARGSPEREELTRTIRQMKKKLPQKIPISVSGSVINSATKNTQLNPSRHSENVAEYASASEQDVNTAIDAALAAKPAWEALPFEDRAAVFLRAAELISGKYRSEILAATMLGQGKNIRQAEVDASTETVDFLRQYVKEAERLFAEQPPINEKGAWNRNEYRPLEGFVYAISPFNFTALGATLIGPPAIMGNVVIWKPSESALHASWVLYQILLEAGLPKDVIQFLPGNAQLVTDAVLKRREFSALGFIGSTGVFKELQGKIGKATGEGRFNSYPRVVGETGGKNFHLVTETADVKSAALNTLRAAFEYQGQKCSACSRVYVAESVWPEFKKHIQEGTAKLKVGPPEDYDNFVNSVIHERSFDKLDQVIESAKSDSELELVAGGKTDKSAGFYVHPTVYQTTNPHHDIMTRELFGPLFGVYVYKDHQLDETLKLIDSTSSYALTGAVFAHDPVVSRKAQDALKHAAGNFYVNTKCTGSVVGRQPFGGSRDSGTNDKTGTMGLLYRYSSIRTIKEEFGPLEEVEYPSNQV
ncbi:putative delta-1-pyrroline-5-carboxylate dehydrogenase, aldehyde dehydrogenase [Septoria linicola]|nr:putative delta-1-pyrroline-5-carboxylate dehydrogenase, aldehyde dehydrogenase [Septoria linicola]